MCTFGDVSDCMLGGRKGTGALVELRLDGIRVWSGMSVLVVLLGKGILQGNGLNVHVLDGKRGCAETRIY